MTYPVSCKLVLLFKLKRKITIYVSRMSLTGKSLMRYLVGDYVIKNIFDCKRNYALVGPLGGGKGVISIFFFTRLNISYNSAVG